MIGNYAAGTFTTGCQTGDPGQHFIPKSGKPELSLDNGFEE